MLPSSSELRLGQASTLPQHGKLWRDAEEAFAHDSTRSVPCVLATKVVPGPIFLECHHQRLGTPFLRLFRTDCFDSFCKTAFLYRISRKVLRFEPLTKPSSLGLAPKCLAPAAAMHAEFAWRV